eukprot:2276865-Rhodomonas_salina.1
MMRTPREDVVQCQPKRRRAPHSTRRKSSWRPIMIMLRLMMMMMMCGPTVRVRARFNGST